MFQTKVDIPPTKLNITYEDKIMTLGSCFADNMGRKMQEVYFETDINPFGVLYNPISIRNSIDLLIENNEFTADNIFQQKELWQSFSHSSLFSATTAERCLENINERFRSAASFLTQTDF